MSYLARSVTGKMLRRSTGAVSDLVLRGNVCFLHQSSVNRFKEGRGTGDQGIHFLICYLFRLFWVCCLLFH